MANDHQDNDKKRPEVDLIRAKIDRLFDSEPDAKTELAEVNAADTKHLSKHQKVMFQLQSSGKSLAEIQTAWHDYYNDLSDNEKHEVWQEFYSQQAKAKGFPSVQPYDPDKFINHSQVNPEFSVNKPATKANSIAQPHPIAKRSRRRLPKTQPVTDSAPNELQDQIKSKLISRRQFEKQNTRLKHNLQSLAFGLGAGLIVLMVFMFSFFNERFIAPFIHPGEASATPIILDPKAVSPTKEPKIIIPKINVEIPLVFDVQSINEAQVQTALEDGVVHYPTTSLPGQKGNGAYFGHSSNNIFNSGKYKFAFVLLSKLEKDDIFYVTYNQKVYVYKVYKKRIVAPTDVEVLNDVPDKTATATLITCDPPGTSLNRLVVWGEQVSPTPKQNSKPKPSKSTAAPPKEIASNGPSLWERVWPF